MRTPCCHSFLAFILKFLNFLQAFVGLAIILYSAYLLNQWQRHNHYLPPPGALNLALGFDVSSLPAPCLNLAGGEKVYICVYGDWDFGMLHNFHWPHCCRGYQWLLSLFCILFSYPLFSASCVEKMSDKGTNSIRKLSQKNVMDDAENFEHYAILATLFILLEAGLVAFIALDHNWEKDIPFDPTGELDRIRTFIEDNVDVFMWVGIAIVVMQAGFVLSLLFALILRSLVSVRQEDDDIEGDYDYRSNSREPLLAPYSSQSSVSARGDSDIWSSRMREKYGLNNGETKSSLLNQNPSSDAKP
ncbi:tetraspanin family protein [Striga asiatica]|uniref:Tetraspanin family protein n=1 Tax=Striga asiatica TaxID=4170 RepID=A0A5A7PB45_STRAF|nr:tetraspanin family protein [Striga asiatica]